MPFTDVRAFYNVFNCLHLNSYDKNERKCHVFSTHYNMLILISIKKKNTRSRKQFIENKKQIIRIIYFNAIKSGGLWSLDKKPNKITCGVAKRINNVWNTRKYNTDVYIKSWYYYIKGILLTACGGRLALSPPRRATISRGARRNDNSDSDTLTI